MSNDGSTKSFDYLASKWKRETSHLSSSDEILSHPAYLAIIERGQEFLHLIVNDLQRTESHWFDALAEITGENPVAEDDRGDIPAMVDAWVQLLGFTNQGEEL